MGGLNNQPVNARRRARAHRVYHHHKHAHKAHRHHQHRYHEKAATWYKHNGVRLYRHNINRSHMFKRGFLDGANANYDSSIRFNGSGFAGGEVGLQRRYVHNSKYKHGWILGEHLGIYYDDETISSIKHLSKSDYAKALHIWNDGLEYFSANPEYGLIDYDKDSGQWSEDGLDEAPKWDHRANPFL